jgi:hypothetical protein
MAQPVWVTPAGSLGTIPEGLFYQVPLIAYDPEILVTITSVIATGTSVTLNFVSQNSILFSVGTSVLVIGFDPIGYNGRFIVTASTASSVTFNNTTVDSVITYGNVQVAVQFEVIAGELPAGIQVEASGLLEGVPRAIANVQGVPLAVSRDITSKFAVRAYTQTVVNGMTVINRLADRTFTLTVTGQDAPEFITPAGTVGTYYDGSPVEGIQIQYINRDPDEIVIVRLVAGSLPPGTSIDPRGLISGFIQPIGNLDAQSGFSRDGQGYDEYPFDFATQSIDQTYEFVLEVTDGTNSNLRTFNILVYSRSSLTADNSVISADNTFITADVTPVRTPIVLTPQGSIGTIRNDNYFAFQFTGIDLDGDQFGFAAFHLVIPAPGEDPIEVPGPNIPGLVLDPNSGWLYGYVPDLGQTEITYDFIIRVFKNNEPSVFSDPYEYSLSIEGSVNTSVIWLVDSDLGFIDNGSVSTLYVSAINPDGVPLFYRLAPGPGPDKNYIPGIYNKLPQGLELLPTGEIAGRVSFNTFAVDGGTTTFDAGNRSSTTFDLTNTFIVNAYSENGLVNVFKTFTIRVVRRYNEPYENLYIEAMPPFESRDIIDSLLDSSQIFPEDLVYRPADPNFGIATNVRYQHAFGLTASTIDDYVSSLNLNHYWKNLVLGSIETARALDDAGNVLYEVVYSRIVDNLVNNSGDSVSKIVSLPYPVSVTLPYPADPSSVSTSVVYPNSLDNMRDQVIDTVGQISNVLPRWMLSKQPDGRILGFVPAWVICYTQPGKSGQIAYNINTLFDRPLNLIDFEVDRYELDRLLTKNWDPVTQSWIPSPPSYTTFDYNTIVTEDTWVNENGSTVTWINDELSTVEWVSRYSGQATVFDGNSLQFTAPVDMYSNTEIYDKYLVFPKRTILG